jgi:hypothetical protein
MNWIGFANPWMLGALAAIGLPVLIHYLTRARPRRIAFPPFQYLLEACAGQQAVHRLRTLILLTVRALAVLALVLLFARPFLKPVGSAASAEAARRVVIVLDASLSMRAVQHGVPLFARAQAAGADLLRGLDAGSEAAVILAGVTPRPLLPALSRNLPALHEALVKSRPTSEFGDPAAALALAKRMLGGPGTVFVLSDFQQSNWRTVPELPAGQQYRLCSVTTEPVDNVALTTVRLSPAEPVVGEPVEVVCTVFNGTSRPRKESVRLELGDFVQERPVTVQPFGVGEAVFNLTFSRPGPVTGRASLPPDDLPDDDTRHIAVRVHKALQVLLVSDTDAADRRSAAFFVSRALAPSPESAPGFAVVRRHSQDTDRGILETADAFVLVAPAMLTGEAVENIGRRINGGAHLVVFLDGPAASTLLPSTFAPPFRLGRAVTAEGGETLAPGPRKLFAEADPSDWTAVQIRRRYQCQLLEDHAGDVMLAYPDGSPALTMTSIGQGSAVFANLPLSADGGDLVGSPMFPSLLHELLRTLRRGAEERTVTPGAAWMFDVSTRGESAVTVSDPDDRVVEAPVAARGRTTRLAMPAAPSPGTYLARQEGATVGAGVVNVDARESDTRPIALENLKSGEGVAVTVVRDEQDLLLAGTTRPLWPALAAAAAALFALEMVLLAVWRRR